MEHAKLLVAVAAFVGTVTASRGLFFNQVHENVMKRVDEQQEEAMRAYAEVKANAPTKTAEIRKQVMLRKAQNTLGQNDGDSSQTEGRATRSGDA